jgi:hypothetical protein
MVTSESQLENVYCRRHYKVLQTLRKSEDGINESSLHFSIGAASFTALVAVLGNNVEMKSGLIIASIAFLMSIGMQSAYAGPFGRMRGVREQARAEHQQRPVAPVERAPVQGGQHFTQAPVFAAPPPGAPGSFGGAQQNQIRKFGPRMSVEERQRLRRQINEAGQDIYAPRK